MSAPERPVHAAEVAAHYDRLDRFYREIWGEHLHHGLWLNGRETPQLAAEQLIEFAVEALGCIPGDRICDVGCGYGATARFLKRRHGLEVTGVTNSRSQFEIARRRPNQMPGVEILWQSWEENELESNSFDGVLAIECLSHIHDKAACFREIQRILRPGGRAVILDWFSGDRPREWELRELLEPICRDGKLAGLQSRSDCSEQIRRTGLKVLSFEDLTGKVRRTWNVLAGRIIGYGLTQPAAWRFAAARPVTSLRYLLTIPRLMIAYRSGALRYGRFVIEKPG